MGMFGNLRLGLGLGSQARAGGGSPTLQSLFANGEGGAAYDAFDLSSLFQDTAGISPATDAGQQIALVMDRIHATHAYQSSVSLRPLIGRAPKRGRVNEIIFTEQFDNPAWAKTGGTILADVALAPDGTMSADRLVEDAGTINGPMVSSGYFHWLGGGALAAGVSIYAKEMPGSAKRYLVFGASSDSTRWIYVVVDLATGAVTAIRGDGVQTGFVANSISVEPAENGFYRISFAPSSPLAGPAHCLRAGVTDNPTPTFTSFQIPPYTGDGASGILLWGAQAERGSVVSSYQRNGANLLDTTQPGVPSYPFVRFDLADDRLDTVLPQAVTGDVVIAGRNGTLIAPASYAAGSTFQLGPTSYTGGVSGILRAVGDVVGWTVIGKTLTAAERKWLLDYYKERGAKGLLVPGPELVVNGTFDVDASGWTPSSANVTAARNASGQLEVTNNGAGWVSQTINTVAGKTYRVEVNWSQKQGTGRFNIGTTVGESNLLIGTVAGNYTGTAAMTFVAISSTAVINLGDSSGGAGTVQIYDNISVRELRPEEEW